MTNSQIIICQDLEYAKEHVLQSIDSKLKKLFFVDEFKVENAASIVKEAYIAESENKYIILSALSYNVYAQNALLKLFEEPPRNIVFIILTRSKNALLPTIRSRLPQKVLSIKKEQSSLDLDIAHLDLEKIFEFLTKHRHVGKEELKDIIQKLLHESVVKNGIKLNAKELEMFDKILELSALNSRGQNLLSYLLLCIYQAKMR